MKSSGQGILEIKNTDKRIGELVGQLENVMAQKHLPRSEAFKLRGRLGFADGFLHGRLGALVLQRFMGHAYRSTSVVDRGLVDLLYLNPSWR